MIFSELTPVLEQIAKRAKADGAEAEVLVTSEDKFSVSMQKGRLDKFDSGQSHCAGVRVIKDGQEGYCSTEDLSEKALLDSYVEALENARFNAKQGIRDETLMMVRAGANGAVESVAPGFGHMRTIEEKLDLARRLEGAALSKDERIAAAPYNGYIESTGAVRVFNSHGVDCAFEQGSIYAYVYALAKSGEESRTGSELYWTRDEKELDPLSIGAHAAEKALAKLGSAQPETGVWPVLLDLEPAAEMIGELAQYLSGKTVAEKRSLFADQIGQKIASPRLTIFDDPFVKLGPGSRPFDSEGTPAAKLPLIVEGELKSFLLNSVFAKRLGLKNTGHAARGPKSELGIGPSNWVVEPGKETRAQLLARHPRTIVITDLAGFHAGFQSGSGDFSLQAEGELWENGVRVGPLSNFVVSGNYRDFLMAIEGVADRPPRPFSNVITPEILVSGLSIAGKDAPSKS